MAGRGEDLLTWGEKKWHNNKNRFREGAKTMEKKLSGGFGLRMFFAVLFLFAAFLAMAASAQASV